MPRIRTLKPDIWLDEDIGKLNALERLTFIGLITQADDEGRLLYRPRILRQAIFPWDDDIDDEKMVALLEGLKRKPFIIIYEANNHKIIQIVGWHKHQKPNHPSPSELAPPPEDYNIIPEDYNIIPEDYSSPLEMFVGNGNGNGNINTVIGDFEKWWQQYPRKVGKQAARRRFLKLIQSGVPSGDLFSSVGNFAADMKRQGRPMDKIQHAATFLGPDKWWEDYVSGIPGMDGKCGSCCYGPKEGAGYCSVEHRTVEADDDGCERWEAK